MSIDYPYKNKRQAKKDIDKNQINSNFSPWKLLFVLSSISIMVMYVETMLLPAIPDIIHDFGKNIACPHGYLHLLLFLL